MANILDIKNILSKFLKGYGLFIGQEISSEFSDCVFAQYAGGGDLQDYNLILKDNSLKLFNNFVFDFICISHLPDNLIKDDFIEIFRVLKIGGSLIICAKNDNIDAILQKYNVQNFVELFNDLKGLEIYNNDDFQIDKHTVFIAKKFADVGLKQLKIKNEELTEQAQEKLNNAYEQIKQNKNVNESISAIEEVHQRSPDNNDIITNLAYIYYQLKNYKKSSEYFEKSYNLVPSYETLNNLGLSYRLLNNYDKAIKLYQQSILHNPKYGSAHLNLGIAYYNVDQPYKAIESYLTAIKCMPDSVDAYYNLGNAYKRLHKNDLAAEAYQKATELNPNFGSAFSNLGVTYVESKNTGLAIECFEKALELNPNDEATLYNYGTLCKDAKNYIKAAQLLERLLQLNPNAHKVYALLGSVYSTQNDYPNAIKYLSKAQEYDKGSYDLFNNLGIIYLDMREIDKAVENFKKVIEIKPDLKQAYNNIGVSYRWNNNIEDSITYFEKALKVDPNYIEARYNMCYSYLLGGYLQKGFENYEQRLKIKEKNQRLLKTDKPLWQGECLKGKIIFAHFEQGLGDSIQFSRYLPQIYGRGASKVLFKPHKGLDKLMKMSLLPELGIEIVDYSTPLDKLEFDIYTYHMSTLKHCNANYDNTPYKDKFYNANPETVEYFKNKYFNNDKFKLGIFWQGSKANKNDAHRSIPLNKLLRFADITNAQLYSLQKGDGTEQLDKLDRDVNIIRLGDEFNNFSDTAAAIMNCDLVIGIDSAIIHLTAGLGKPACVMLCYAADWRWQKDIEHSIWYDNVKVFRQKQRGNWDECINNILNFLKPATGLSCTQQCK